MSREPLGTVTRQVPQRGVRHPMTVVMQARRFREAGWMPAEIVGLLADDGAPSLRSVIRWTEPEVAEADRRRDLRRRRRQALERSGRLGSAHCTPEFKLARVRALRVVGLSYEAIARTMLLDFDDGLSAHQVRHALKSGRYPSQTEARS